MWPTVSPALWTRRGTKFKCHFVAPPHKGMAPQYLPGIELFLQMPYGQITEMKHNNKKTLVLWEDALREIKLRASCSSQDYRALLTLYARTPGRCGPAQHITTHEFFMCSTSAPMNCLLLDSYIVPWLSIYAWATCKLFTLLPVGHNSQWISNAQMHLNFFQGIPWTTWYPKVTEESSHFTKSNNITWVNKGRVCLSRLKIKLHTTLRWLLDSI